MFFTRHHENICRGNQRLYPVNGFLNNGFFACDVQKVFGSLFSAAGPESDASASGHDHCVHDFSPCFFGIKNKNDECL